VRRLFATIKPLRRIRCDADFKGGGRPMTVEQLYTPQETAKLLGISVDTLMAHVHAGDISYVLVGRGTKHKTAPVRAIRHCKVSGSTARDGGKRARGCQNGPNPPRQSPCIRSASQATRPVGRPIRLTAHRSAFARSWPTTINSSRGSPNTLCRTILCVTACRDAAGSTQKRNIELAKKLAEVLAIHLKLLISREN
jgi:excisionase family DNA binding protein